MSSKKILISFGRVLLLTLIVLVIISAGFLGYLMAGKTKSVQDMVFGVTFSQPFAIQMGLDWQEAYLAILDDLGVRNLRLSAYWPEIEPANNEYVFKDLDWQIQEAEKRNVKIILAIGRKLPRWPECHTPDWAKELTEQEQQEKIILLLTEIIKRYKGNSAVWAWQIENEPFFESFGDCPSLDEKFLDQEIFLARSLDSRQIIITASGELSTWLNESERADVLGTTLYRVVWDKRFGHIRYPIPPIFYQKRANIMKRLFGLDKVMVVELAAEPWGEKLIYDSTLEEQFESMNLKEFKSNISYVRQTGFEEAYLWGAEWWYWLKLVHQDESIWREAQKLWP